MQITATGLSSVYSPQTASRGTEASERGPDKDNDGDEAKVAAPSSPLPSPPPGRGGKLDMLA
ncbi:hypothetical protein [Magnetospirillum sp. 64-120]|uniref:hypothetical protein n=1 Tax=Magnetospirillum sp. 64-120 TaxID=1895778 RepID=UPI0009279DCA|nr:hypothetical protein [Magnetospirillum sp. 64-120]OJX71796.1 MAG: hypothetical protein BGO92_04175 [Magnetospirillum sp. 64-120]